MATAYQPQSHSVYVRVSNTLLPSYIKFIKKTYLSLHMQLMKPKPIRRDNGSITYTTHINILVLKVITERQSQFQ